MCILYHAVTEAPSLVNVTAPDGDIKRLLLDRSNYYATTGGHGGCRGLKGCKQIARIDERPNQGRKEAVARSKGRIENSRANHLQIIVASSKERCRWRFLA